jgi:hypothetical protein
MNNHPTSIGLQQDTNRILDRIGKPTDFAYPGRKRDTLRPGPRTAAWRRKLTITFAVGQAAAVFVEILYSGRDFETLLDKGD